MTAQWEIQRYETTQKEYLSISSNDSARVNRLPDQRIKEINQNIHDYIESACRDYEKEKEQKDGGK